MNNVALSFASAVIEQPKVSAIEGVRAQRSPAICRRSGRVPASGTAASIELEIGGVVEVTLAREEGHCAPA